MKKGVGVKKADRRDLADDSIQRKYTTTSKGRKHLVSDIELDAYPVDHSLAGASGYIFHTSKGNIAYTGDLRFHGYDSKATEEYVKALEETDIKILLCEGTRAEGLPGPNEHALSEEMKKAIEKTRELVLIYYPQRDSARMRTIVEAAKACDRKVLINPKQAFFLDQIKGCSDAILPDTNNIEILLPRKAWGIWGNPAYDDKIQKQDYTNAYPTPVRDFIFEQSNLVTPQEVAQSQKEYVVSCSFYEMNLLHDLSPKEGSCFIWSKSDPFDEEGSIELAKVENWLSHFKLGEPIPMHCSGHLSGPEAKDLIDRAQPEMVVPIHTEKPQAFKSWHDNVIIVHRNETLKL
jgi:ribonuclease J